MLRPVAVAVSAPVLDVAPTETGYAVLTTTGIDLVDAELSVQEHIGGGDGSATTIAVLPDGRFLCGAVGNGGVFLAKRGESLAKREDLGTVRVALPTREGFIAIATDKIWVDRNGEGRWLENIRSSKGTAAWGDRFIAAGTDKLTVIDAAGETRELAVPDISSIAVLGDLLAVRSGKRTQLFDAELAPLAATGDDLRLRIGDRFIGTDANGVVCRSLVTAPKTYGSRDELAADRRGYVFQAEIDAVTGDLSPEDKDAWVKELVAPRPPGGAQDIVTRAALVREWHHELAAPELLRAAGNYVVYRAGKHNAFISLDGALSSPNTQEPLLEACAFGDGIASVHPNHTDALWWHGGQVEKLPHDFGPTLVRAVPAGAFTAEGRYLYLWRTDVNGPEYTPVATAIPLEVPVIAGGRLVRALAPKRFVVFAHDQYKRTVALAPNAPWRHPVSKEDATAIMERLVARDTEGEAPALPGGDTEAAIGAAIAQLPPIQTAVLHARAMFAPNMLDDRTRKAIAFARESFLAELGLALGVPGRVVGAGAKGRKFPLPPPRELAGYDYLGSFTTSGALVVADPAYVGSKRAPGATALAVRLKASEGLWHVYARNGDGADAARTAELVAIHTDGFDTYATDIVGTIVVDSGSAGVFDKACPKRDRDAPIDEGTQGGLGALSYSGNGAGSFPVYAGKIRGIIVKLRIGYLEGTTTDRTFATPRKGRQYSPKVHFSLGEVIEHPKFGAGTVTAVSGDGKIDVAFDDGKRTLVHLK